MYGTTHITIGGAPISTGSQLITLPNVGSATGLTIPIGATSCQITVHPNASLTESTQAVKYSYDVAADDGYFHFLGVGDVMILNQEQMESILLWEYLPGEGGDVYITYFS